MAGLRRIIGIAFTLALVLTGATFLDTPAQAATVQCGQVINQSVVLQNDVGPCNNTDGLVVDGGSNISINLNGHRVFADAPLPRRSGTRNTQGTDNPNDDTFGCTSGPTCVFVPLEENAVGINILDGVNVRVIGPGTVEGFAAGVAIDGGSTNMVQGITARNNQGPCIGEDFTTQATGSYGDGIVLFSSNNNNIANNRVENNGPFSGISIATNTIDVNVPDPSFPLPTGNKVMNNTVLFNNKCFADIGIRLEGPGASNNTVGGNTVQNSYQEGIAVLSVNTFDFRGAFANPPTCQVRGVPSPTLPVCPWPNGRTPTNDNNIIQGNPDVSRNGGGGVPQTLAGPTTSRPLSRENAAGIQLLAFCGAGTGNGKGNEVNRNTVTQNYGNGIAVGGCSVFNAPPNSNPIGFHDNRIVANTSVNNNQNGCPQGGSTSGSLGSAGGPCGARISGLSSAGAPSTPCPSGQPTCGVALPRYDLFDGNNVASTPTGNPAPFVIGQHIIEPGGTPCDNNYWFANRYGTAFPACTTNGGTQISSASTASAASVSSASAASSGPADARSAGAGGYSRRG